jgi:hydroxyethylthiazole kinase-like uncharacterized protein yjeF
MTELLTAAQMRAIEEAAIASGEVTGLELMERAGRGVVEAIFEEWPELARAPHRALVLCGPGNNGGDGFVVARLLKEWGWEVEVFLYGDPEKLPPDARVNYERWCDLGSVQSWDAYDVEGTINNEPDFVVDALFGTGLAREMDPVELSGAFDAIKDHLYMRFAHAVAIDMPSGISSESGHALGFCFPTELTVTFHKPKVGHFLSDGPSASSRIRVVDIGLPYRFDRTSVCTTSAPRWPATGKSTRAHKYTHGHALILSGGPGRGGAARLAARGALRIGAGLVTVGCPPEALAENASRLDAIMLKPVHDADALTRILEDTRINALCLGPGLGKGDREAALVAAALSGTRPTVLDADALTILAQHPDLFAALHRACVLTPHAGEFSRLFPDIAGKLAAPATKGPAYSKVDATREAAARAGCTVLFKGPDTVIADPSGRCAINSAHYDRAAPWLATAGSGDVLAGFIAGLLARGLPPMQAAEAAAWLHVDCALSFGPGLIAEDIPEELPKVFRKLGL